MTTGRTARRFGLAALALGLAAASVAPALAQSAPAQGKRGGSMRFVSGAGSGTLDPHINYTSQYFQLNYALYDGLLTFRKADGVAGNEVVPDLAEDRPTYSYDQTTLTFKLRSGVRFSNGKEVTVDDVAASIRRIFKVRSPVAEPFFGNLIGAEKCVADPDTCVLEGGLEVDAANRTVTFHLIQPDFEFEQKLSLPLAAILPADTPPRDQGGNPIPGTGPYMVESVNPQRGMRLVRNPRFKEFSRDAQPDGWVDTIDYDFGLSEEEQIDAVGRGKADWMFDNLPAEYLSELAIKYARRLHVRQLASLWYAAMNTRLAPFDDVRARQAVNFAIDRAALVKAAGGVNLGAATCQILPPNINAYSSYCPYTQNPGAKWIKQDIGRARDLVNASGTAGMPVEIVVKDAPNNRAVGEIIVDALKKIGYKASMKLLAKDKQTTFIQNTNNKVQMSVSVWAQDYPAPSDFLKVLFSCASFHPGSDASINISGFCDKDIDAKMEAATRLSATDPRFATKLWSEIDHTITDRAPIAPLFNPKQITFLSGRVRNFEFNDQMNWIFTKAWVE